MLSPGQHDAQQGGRQQTPRQRIAIADQQAQHGQHQHKGADIDRAHRAVGAFLQMLFPVLGEIEAVLHQIVEHLLGRQHLSVAHVDPHIFYSLLGTVVVEEQVHRCAALGVGHQQRPRLADAVTIVGDIRALQTARRLVGRILFHQFALATHGLLGVLPGVVEVRGIDQHAQQTANEASPRGLQEPAVFLLDDSVCQEGDRHKQDDEQIIIGHLHVVGMNLQRSEDARHHQAPQVLAPIGQHDAANHWRQIGQGHHLPQVAGGDDDQEIGAERPEHSAQGRQMLAEVEGPQQDVESQQIDEQVPHIVGQPQVIGLLEYRHRVGAVVRRCYLVGGHTGEQTVGPACPLAGLLQILRCLLAGADAGRDVALVQHTVLHVGRIEIGKSQNGKKHNGRHVEQALL